MLSVDNILSVLLRATLVLDMLYCCSVICCTYYIQLLPLYTVATQQYDYHKNFSYKVTLMCMLTGPGLLVESLLNMQLTLGHCS